MKKKQHFQCQKNICAILSLLFEMYACASSEPEITLEFFLVKIIFMFT